MSERAAFAAIAVAVTVSFFALSRILAYAISFMTAVMVVACT